MFIMTNSNTELNGHHLLGVVGVLLEVPPDHMHTTGQGLEEVHSFLSREIVHWEDVLDPAGHQKLLEIGREGRSHVWYVLITYDNHD